jgi:hypothetical protein
LVSYCGTLLEEFEDEVTTGITKGAFDEQGERSAVWYLPNTVTLTKSTEARV